MLVTFIYLNYWLVKVSLVNDHIGLLGTDWVSGGLFCSLKLV